MALPIFPTVLKGISVIGSIVGTRQDLAEVFELHAAGRTRVIAETRKLDEVNASIDDVLAGRVTGADGLRVLRPGTGTGSGAGVGLGRSQRPEDAGVDRGGVADVDELQPPAALHLRDPPLATSLADTPPAVRFLHEGDHRVP